MGLLEDKKSAAALIIRKIGKPDSDYDSLKSANEEMKQVPMKDGAEIDNATAFSSAVEEMMSAVEVKDASRFKMALDSYLQMWMDYEKGEGIEV